MRRLLSISEERKWKVQQSQVHDKGYDNYKLMLTKDKIEKTIDELSEEFTVDQIVEQLVILNKIEE